MQDPTDPSEATRAGDVFAACRDRIDRGETVDPEELIRGNPDIADDLRRMFAALAAVEGALAAPSVAAEADSPSAITQSERP